MNPDQILASSFNELVDFKEQIGFWSNKGGTETLPTTKGVIHYSKDGAHIIPAHPDAGVQVSISSIRCSLQVALLGEVTKNLRAVTANLNEQSLSLCFFYENPPSDVEEGISENVCSEVLSDFGCLSIALTRKVIPISNKIHETGIIIYHRHE